MKQSKTKKALLMSLLSMTLCVAMLVGMTFAWFTDTASTKVNTIQAGNLDVALEMWNGEKWVSAEGETLNFVKASSAAEGEAVLWEPGCTYELPKVKVVNEGNLALKYKVVITGVVGDNNLAEVLEIKMNGQTLKNAGKAITLNDAITSTDADGFAHGNLAAGKDSGEITIALHMKEEAGNEYQGESVSGITIAVLATQDTVESDSYGNQYDKNAEYPTYYDVTTDDSTTAADLIVYLTEGKSVYLTEDINISGQTITINDDVQLGAAEGVKIDFGSTSVRFEGSGSLTVNGGDLETEYELTVADDFTLTFNGGTHTFNAFYAVGNGKIVVNGGTLNLAGTYGNSNSVKFRGNGSLYVNGGTLNLDRPIDMGNDGCDKVYVEINGGTINMKDSKLFVTRNVLEKDRTSGRLRGSSVKITGGVFNTTFTMDSDGDANAFIRNEDKLVSGDTKRIIVSNSDEYNCVVTGGTFYGCWARNDNYRLSNDEDDKIENTIAGFVADGYQITGDETNGYVVSKK